MNTITHTIPVKPLSVNAAWQGRRFKTKEYDTYRKECMLQMPSVEQITQPVVMVVGFFVKYPKKCDTDNFLKPLLDIIVKKGWLKDDRQVVFLVAFKAETQKEERSVVSITPAILETWKETMNKVDTMLVANKFYG